MIKALLLLSSVIGLAVEADVSQDGIPGQVFSDLLEGRYARGLGPCDLEYSDTLITIQQDTFKTHHSAQKWPEHTFLRFNTILWETDSQGRVGGIMAISSTSSGDILISFFLPITKKAWTDSEFRGAYPSQKRPYIYSANELKSLFDTSAFQRHNPKHADDWALLYPCVDES